MSDRTITIGDGDDRAFTITVCNNDSLFIESFHGDDSIMHSTGSDELDRLVAFFSHDMLAKLDQAEDFMQQYKDAYEIGKERVVTLDSTVGGLLTDIARMEENENILRDKLDERVDLGDSNLKAWAIEYKALDQALDVLSQGGFYDTDRMNSRRDELMRCIVEDIADRFDFPR